MEGNDSKIGSEKIAEMQGPILSSERSSHSIEKGEVVTDVVTGRTLEKSTGILARLLAYEEWLDRKLGVEPHGPQRVLPENRKAPRTYMMFFMWSSAGAYTLGSIATGMLPWELGLSFTQGTLIIAFASLLGCMCAVSRVSSPLQTTH